MKDGLAGLGQWIILRTVCAGRGKFSAIWRAEFAECFQWVAGRWGLTGWRAGGWWRLGRLPAPFHRAPPNPGSMCALACWRKPGILRKLIG